MDIKAARAGMFTMKIELGEFFGVEPDAAWVKMREWNRNEQQEISEMQRITDEAKKEKAWMDYAYKKFPELITEHNFEDEGKPVDNQTVTDLICSRVSAYGRVWKDLTEKNPFLPKQQETLAKLR